MNNRKKTTFKLPGSKQNGELLDSTTRGFFWIGTGSGGESVLQIIVLAILARLIDPGAFGVAQLALVVISLANLISQMGVGPALIQRKELTKYHIRIAFTISFSLGILLGIITFTTSGFLASFFGMPALEAVLQAISILFVIESFVVVSESLLQKKMKLKLYATSNFLSYLLGYGLVGITLAYLDFGVWALIYAVIAQSIVKAIIFSIMEPHSILPLFKRKEFNELFYMGGGFTIGRVANFVAGQGDSIVIGKFLGADALGLYSRAYALMFKPVQLIGSSLDKALFPAMSSIQEDKQKLSEAFLRSVSSIAFLSLPLSLLMVLLAPEIIGVILGSDWTGAVVPLQILASAMVFRMGYKVSGSLSRATGAVYQRAWRQIVFAIAVISGAIIGQNWGIVGVSWSIFGALILNYFMMAHLGIKICGLSWVAFIKAHFQGIVNSCLLAVPAVIVLYFCREGDLANFLTLVISMFVSLLFYSFVIYKWSNYFLNKDGAWVLSYLQKILASSKKDQK